MNYKHNHGGNPKGVSDCVARALAITLKRPYYEVAQAAQLNSVFTTIAQNLANLRIAK